MSRAHQTRRSRPVAHGASWLSKEGTVPSRIDEVCGGARQCRLHPLSLHGPVAVLPPGPKSIVPGGPRSRLQSPRLSPGTEGRGGAPETIGVAAYEQTSRKTSSPAAGVSGTLCLPNTGNKIGHRVNEAVIRRPALLMAWGPGNGPLPIVASERERSSPDPL